MKSLLVTGMQRSGTTLVDRLLDNHPEMSVFSQPLPLLFVEVKREFLRQRLGEESAYPLSPLFDERRYHTEDFTSWLTDFRLGPDRLRRVLDSMAGFSGQLTQFSAGSLEPILDSLRSGSVADVLTDLYTALSTSRDVAVVGSKEVTCEEFVPHQLQRGGYAVIAIRDPRGVISSLNHGRGRDHTGRLKPILFNLRSWRKSIAFALRLQDHPRFARVGYEELTIDPGTALGPVTRMLGVADFDPATFRNELNDTSGEAWHGNSSHGAKHGVTTDSVERWRSTLSAETTRFIEAVCFPELKALGLAVTISWDEVADIITEYQDPYPLERPELASYTERAARDAEVERLDLLSKPACKASRSAYIFEDVRSHLHDAVLNGTSPEEAHL